MTIDETVINWIEGIRSSLAAQARERGLLPPTDKWDPVDIVRRLDTYDKGKRHAGRVKEAEKIRDDFARRKINTVLNVARGDDAAAGVKPARRASVHQNPHIQKVLEAARALKPYAKAAGGNIQDALQGKAPSSFTGPGPAFGDIGGHGSNTAPTTGLIAAKRTDPGAQAREKERALEPILNMISQRGSPADKGILSGAFDWPRLFQVMAGMPGAHMQNPYGGGSFLTDFAISGQNVAAARSAAALEQEKLRSKERVAGASKRPKLTGPASKAIDGYFSGIRGKKLTDDLRTVMLERFTSGIGSDAIGLLTGIGSFFGVDIAETGGMEAKGIADLVKNELAASGLFGDQTSKAELKLLIDKIVKNPGTIKNEEAVRQSLDRLDKLFDNMRIRAEAKLTTFDYDVEKLKRNYDSGVNPGKVWSKEQR